MNLPPYLPPKQFLSIPKKLHHLSSKRKSKRACCRLAADFVKAGANKAEVLKKLEHMFRGQREKLSIV